MTLSISRRKTLWRLATAGSLAALAGAAQSQNLHFYTLGPSQLNIDRALAMASYFKLTPAKGSQFNGQVYQMGDGSVRGYYMGGAQGSFVIEPDLRTENTALPAVQTSQALALRFTQQFPFFPKDIATYHFGPISTWGRNTDSATGGQGKQVDLIRSFRFYRTLDNMAVYGPSSIATVLCDANGVVSCTNSLLPAVQTTMIPTPKTADQVNHEFQMMLDNYHTTATPTVLSKRLIYFEQGMKFIQPVWLFDVQFRDPKGTTFCNYFVVPWATNSPEPINDCADGQKPIFPVTPVPGPEALELSGKNIPSSWIAGLNAAQANPVQVGEYIVREDHPCWLGDAQAFWGSLSFWDGLTSFIHPGVNRRDYWWDEPWCWEAALGIPDNSQYYPGQDQFALIEGHGAPWEITCLRNNAEFIYLRNLAGFGSYGPYSSEVTAYIMWQSCDVIPEPGHAFGGDFNSGTAWDVWWGVFKGMRANFGYRTLMHICNGVGGIFGVKEGLGIQNVSGWLSSTDEGVFAHLDGLDYGSCVLVSGHEGDTIFNNSQLPPPGSLTMWWIHP